MKPVTFRQLCRTFCLAASLLVTATLAHAAGTEVRQPILTQTEDGVTLTGHFALTLSPTLSDAVNHGMPLVFQIELEVTRPRWYWFDEALLKTSVERRLTYNALGRNYRVSEDQGGRNFAELSDALAYVARPVTWPLPISQAKAGATLELALRFRLDQTLLPKPFQLISLSDPDWRLDSDWRRFRLTVPAAGGSR